MLYISVTDSYTHVLTITNLDYETRTIKILRNNTVHWNVLIWMYLF